MTADTSGLEAAAFAGRTAELTTLRTAAEVARTGRFSAALISGEPGIGKTRLVDETCNHARELGFEVAAGRCFDTQSRLSYYPFIQAFRQLVAQASLPAEKRKDGARRTGQAAEIVARLALRVPRSSKLNSELSSVAQTELFESVVCFLRVRSQNCPLLLVLEDLHWADKGSLSLLLHTVRTLASAPLVIIGTCRGPDGAERFELGRTIIELGRHQSCQRIRLRGLTETETASLVEQLLGSELDSETKRLAADIGRLTSGNPLFVHQIVRHLVETGRLSRQGDQWCASSGWESKLAAEDGMREVVDARLLRLSDHCRDALNHAAVLGDEFELEVLAQMLPLAVQDLADILEEASVAGIVTEARCDESADYAFAHGLIRQSLYERQSRPAKRALHAAAAHAIEAVHGASRDSHVSQLALHYTKAGVAGDLAKATEYSMRAGEMAYAVCAYADAAFHWHAALKLAGAGDRRLHAELLERLGEASLRAVTPAEAARHLQAALKLYTELRQQPDIARVHARLVTVISLLSMNPAAIDMDQAVSHSQRAEKLLAVRADQSAEGELLVGEALAAHAQFRTEDGLIASERAMSIGEQLDDPGTWCQAAALHGHFLWASGRLAAGFTLMEQALERAEGARDPKQRFAAAWALGFSNLLLWDPAGAQRAIELGLANSDTGQMEFLRQVLVAHLGIAHTFTGALASARSLLTIAPHRFFEANLRFFEGEWSQTEELLSQQIERAHLAQSRQQHWTASLWLARLKRVQGNYPRARELLTNTPLMTESLQRVPEEITTRSELTLVRLAQGEVADARSEVSRCRFLLSSDEDWRALSAFVDRAEAMVLAHEGFPEEASRLAMLAENTFSRYQLPWEVAETLATWGSQLLRHGKTEQGQAHLSAAAQIYRHLELGERWHSRIEELRRSANVPSAPRFDAPAVAPRTPDTAVPASAPSDGINSLVTTHDVALLATLIHDAIAHLMNAIDKASKLRGPVERIAAATERISKISAPVERLARSLEQAVRNSALAQSHESSQRTRPGRSRRQKLDRSHEPGRPL